MAGRFFMLVRQKLSDYLKPATRFYNTISITGAGGKTTILNYIGKMWADEGKKIMLTTTTHLAKNVKYSAEEIIKGPLSYNGANSVLYIADDDVNPEKYKTPGVENIDKLSRYFDKVIIEADGSAGLSLKYHSEKDPVIIQKNQFTFCVLGLNALGEKIEDNMHSYQSYFQEFPSRSGGRVELIDFENLFYSKQGVLKGVGNSKAIFVLNQADTIEDMTLLKKIINFAASVDALVTSFEKNIVFTDSTYAF